MLRKKNYLFIASFMLLIPISIQTMQRVPAGMGSRGILQRFENAKTMINNAKNIADLNQVDNIINQFDPRSGYADELLKLKTAKENSLLAQQAAKERAQQKVVAQQLAKKKAAAQQLAQQQAQKKRKAAAQQQVPPAPQPLPAQKAQAQQLAKKKAAAQQQIQKKRKAAAQQPEQQPLPVQKTQAQQQAKAAAQQQELLPELPIAEKFRQEALKKLQAAKQQAEEQVAPQEIQLTPQEIQQLERIKMSEEREKIEQERLAAQQAALVAEQVSLPIPTPEQQAALVAEQERLAAQQAQEAIVIPSPAQDLEFKAETLELLELLEGQSANLTENIAKLERQLKDPSTTTEEQKIIEQNLENYKKNLKENLQNIEQNKAVALAAELTPEEVEEQLSAAQEKLKSIKEKVLDILERQYKVSFSESALVENAFTVPEGPSINKLVSTKRILDNLPDSILNTLPEKLRNITKNAFYRYEKSVSAEEDVSSRVILPSTGIPLAPEAPRVLSVEESKETLKNMQKNLVDYLVDFITKQHLSDSQTKQIHEKINELFEEMIGNDRTVQQDAIQMKRENTQSAVTFITQLFDDLDLGKTWFGRSKATQLKDNLITDWDAIFNPAPPLPPLEEAPSKVLEPEAPKPELSPEQVAILTTAQRELQDIKNFILDNEFVRTSLSDQQIDNIDVALPLPESFTQAQEFLQDKDAWIHNKLENTEEAIKTNVAQAITEYKKQLHQQEIADVERKEPVAVHDEPAEIIVPEQQEVVEQPQDLEKAAIEKEIQELDRQGHVSNKLKKLQIELKEFEEQLAEAIKDEVTAQIATVKKTIKEIKNDILKEIKEIKEAPSIEDID